MTFGVRFALWIQLYVLLSYVFSFSSLPPVSRKIGFTIEALFSRLVAGLAVAGWRVSLPAASAPLRSSVGVPSDGPLVRRGAQLFRRFCGPSLATSWCAALPARRLLPEPRCRGPPALIARPLGWLQAVPWRAFFARPALWSMMYCHFAGNWGHFTLLAWLPTYFSEVLHLDLTHAALVSRTPKLAERTLAPHCASCIPGWAKLPSCLLSLVGARASLVGLLPARRCPSCRPSPPSSCPAWRRPGRMASSPVARRSRRSGLWSISPRALLAPGAAGLKPAQCIEASPSLDAWCLDSQRPPCNAVA